jgi:hypothetical protein
LLPSNPQSLPCRQCVNIEAPLYECTISEQHAVIRFLWAEWIKPSEIHRRMLVQYGDKYIGQRKIYEWVERFKNGRTNVIDEDRLGCPITSSSVTNVDQYSGTLYGTWTDY